MSAPPAAAANPNLVSPVRFIVGFGVVSALADMVYEGARSIIGPFLASLGASAAVVGLVTGAGEAAALVLRLGTGRLADRSPRPWAQTIAGYGLTAICVPLLALAGGVPVAGLLYNGERVGKAVRTPARDSMLAHASAGMGRGYAFGLHEALDQIGAIAGPLLLAAVLGLGGTWHTGFALLAVPGAAALLMLARLRRRAPDPAAWEPSAKVSETKRLRLDTRLPGAFWRYAAFSAATMLGFATWAVLAYHLTVHRLVPEAMIPVLYALAMAAASVAAVLFGRLYDRVGLSGLAVLPPLAVVVPVLAFSSAPAAFVLGAVVWGAGMGMHDSTLRAAVADLVPAHRRGAGYGTFTAVYGLAWLAGATVIGLLYSHGVGVVTGYVAATQALALIVLVPLIRHTDRRAPAPGHRRS